ncbi:MAG: hypothetical protein SPI86_02235 [Treponemataceae bacterium]|nr:hypothetical protein [Spirochaetales bacterium]MDY6030560.1 hypothetical protein [Treponemataceae bacterium]
MENKIDDVDLLDFVSSEDRDIIIHLLEFEYEQNVDTSANVCSDMEKLFNLKHKLSYMTAIIGRLDSLMKFAIRKNAFEENVSKYFRVNSPLKKYRIDDSDAMMKRLLQEFNNPMDFSSCVKFDGKKIEELLGVDFIFENSDIISEYEYAPAVYLRKQKIMDADVAELN